MVDLKTIESPAHIPVPQFYNS